MKTLLALLITTLTGCANIGSPTIKARQMIHAEAMAHAQETIREANDWRQLGREP